MFYPQFGVQPYPHQGGQGVDSFNARTGVVTPAANDYNAGQITETADRLFMTANERTRISGTPVDIREYGSGTDLTANFSAALADTAPVIYVPPGVWTADYIEVARNVRIVGAGRRQTTLDITGHVTYADIPCGILLRGAVASPTLSDTAAIDDILITFSSAEVGQVGVLATRRVDARGLRVQGAPSHGVLLRSIAPSSECPYFSTFTDCVFKGNGGSGFLITDTVNGTLFLNSQFTSNALHGLHQKLQGYAGQNQAIYNTTVIQGQAAYNDIDGIFFENGSNCHVYGTYAEFNSDADGGNPKTGAGKNVRLGVNVTRMNIFIGEVGTNVDPHLTLGVSTGSTTNSVYLGGSRVTPYENINIGLENVGAGRALTFQGALNCKHTLLFRETTNDRHRLLFDGATNDLSIDAWTSGNSWVTNLAFARDGGIGFYGTAPIPKPTIAGSRDGNAALESLFTALANLGLITDSSS